MISSTLKNGFLVLLSAACLTASLPVSAVTAAESADRVQTSAQTDAPKPISPAIGILAAEQTLRKSGLYTEDIRFSSADFEKVLGYTPTEVTICSLPAKEDGCLRLGSLALEEGQILSAQTLENLHFVPASDTEECRASFTFTARGRTFSTDTALTCFLFARSEKNEAPAAEDAAVSTYCALPVYAAIRASDPEQDALRYTVVREPKKGTVHVHPADGTFVYTPDEGARGRDVFTCRVTDCYGGESNLCRVKVTIQKPETGVRYDDLKDHWAACAAMHLAESGILVGEQCGDTMLFHPDKAVTRGDFLVMAMQAAGLSADASAQPTVFADDGDIPDYMKGCVRLAYENGIISGTDTEPPRFLPQEIITRAEAAVILNRLFSVKEAPVLPVFADRAALPAWSAGAVYALHAAGILSGADRNLEPLGQLDRAQAAQLLSMAMDYADRVPGR